ncbi:MAG TPA: hypothetical protein VFX96_06730 [Pyrinomonadaceae bacterium]|nr:hypothetical protein [Pyrinomonadaceae bacterium]
MKAKEKLTVFVAHSFAADDMPVFNAVADVIRRAGFSVSSGDRPEALTVSSKVRGLIESADIFVAIMTHRHEVVGKHLWTTNPWVIEEKGYALGQKPLRPIVALVEENIPVPTETGGLEGDLEVIFFNRKRFDAAQKKLRQVLATLKP